jgi:Ala-tRNA(Pro) deacylase
MNLTKFLDQSGITYRIYYHDKTYDAQHMAQLLHVTGRKIAKAVMVRDSKGPRFIVVVVPAANRVDLRRVAAVLEGTDVRLATELEIREHCAGCESGVVPVFGSHYGMQTIVDESVSRQDELIFQGNTHAESVSMRFADFYILEHPRIATIAEQHDEKSLAL